MGFELQAHTADVAVAATGDSLVAVFAAAADGLAAAMCDEIPPEPDDRFSISVRAESREALLFDYLDELIYLRDVRGELPVDNRVESIDAPAADDDGSGAGDGNDSNGNGSTDSGGDGRDEWILEANARGVPLSAIDAREVKAVTYSEMRLERAGDGWEAYVVFDV